MREWARLAATGALGTRLEHKDRALLLEYGCPADSVFFLADGTVELIKQTHPTKSIIVKLMVGPTLMGVNESIGHLPEYLVTARVAGRATIYRMSVPLFLQLLRDNNAACYECLMDLGVAFGMAARFQFSTLYPPEALLANLLLGYADVFGAPADDGVTIQLRRTQLDFADGIAAGERSVNRLLSDWKRAGLIGKRRGLYTVRSTEWLTRTAGNLVGSLVLRASSPSQVPMESEGGLTAFR